MRLLISLVLLVAFVLPVQAQDVSDLEKEASQNETAIGIAMFLLLIGLNCLALGVLNSSSRRRRRNRHNRSELF